MNLLSENKLFEPRNMKRFAGKLDQLIHQSLIKQSLDRREVNVKADKITDDKIVFKVEAGNNTFDFAVTLIMPKGAATPNEKKGEWLIEVFDQSGKHVFGPERFKPEDYKEFIDGTRQGNPFFWAIQAINRHLGESKSTDKSSDYFRQKILGEKKELSEANILDHISAGNTKSNILKTFGEELGRKLRNISLEMLERGVEKVDLPSKGFYSVDGEKYLIEVNVDFSQDLVVVKMVGGDVDEVAELKWKSNQKVQDITERIVSAIKTYTGI